VRLLLLGAGGFARELTDMCRELGHEVVALFSEDEPGSHVYGLPIVRTIDAVDVDSAVVAVGDSRLRHRWWAMLPAALRCEPLVHHSASVSPSADIGPGTAVMQNAVITSGARVAENVLVNVGCYVSHDCFVGAHTHLAGGVMLGGYSRVGDRCLCGTGAVLLPSVRVGDDSVCGAGAVVTDHIAAGVTVAGVPARRIGPGATDE